MYLTAPNTPIRGAIIWLCAFSQFTACSSLDETGSVTLDCNSVEGEPSIELGTGALEFEPISNGDDLFMDQGTQGLFHVFGSILATGILAGNQEDFSDPMNPMASFMIYYEGDIFGGYEPLPRPLNSLSGSVSELVGDIVLLDITSFGQAQDLSVTFHVDLWDACGVELSDSREVRLHHPDAKSSFTGETEL